MKSRKRDSQDYEVLRHERAILKSASMEQQRRIIEKMSVEDAIKYDADFETWAHANQLPPSSEGWRVWLMMAGRGFGKTRAGAEWQRSTPRPLESPLLRSGFLARRSVRPRR